MDGELTGLTKQIHVARDIPAICPEMVDLELQRVGNIHRRAIAPQLAVVALRQLIVQHNKIADAFKFCGRDMIIFVDNKRPEILVGKQRQQLRYARLNQMQAGRFERFHMFVGKEFGAGLELILRLTKWDN